MPVTHLDSSAIVKLVVQEPESDALRRFLRKKRPLVSSALARTEVLRAILPAGEAAVARGREVLATVDLVRVNERILNAAGALLPAEIRSLDAIHLATARLLGHDLSHIVTYDERLAEAAKLVGLRLVGPR